jgi:hypothetical protein
MRNISLIPIVSVLLLFSSVRGLAQAPVPEKVFEGANGLRIHVKEVAPGAQLSSDHLLPQTPEDRGYDSGGRQRFRSRIGRSCPGFARQ